MPIIKSAKKRVRVSQKATIRNAKVKRSMRESLKNLQKAIASKKTSDIQVAQNQAISAIDTPAKKNVIHANKAARKKSQVSAAVKASGTKPATAKKVDAKPTAKTATTKKVVAKTATKSPATKKPVAKKPVAKKTGTKKPAPKK